jgi:nicotinamidase-related amidase
MNGSTTITPARTALMLMDFQPAILAIGDTDTLLNRAHAAQSWARPERVQIVYVRIAFTLEDFALIPSHNKSPSFVRRDSHSSSAVNALRNSASLGSMTSSAARVRSVTQRARCSSPNRSSS